MSFNGVSIKFKGCLKSKGRFKDVKESFNGVPKFPNRDLNLKPQQVCRSVCLSVEFYFQNQNIQRNQNTFDFERMSQVPQHNPTLFARYGSVSLCTTPWT